MASVTVGTGYRRFIGDYPCGFGLFQSNFMGDLRSVVVLTGLSLDTVRRSLSFAVYFLHDDLFDSSCPSAIKSGLAFDRKGLVEDERSYRFGRLESCRLVIGSWSSSVPTLLLCSLVRLRYD
jgi:hypothetical protein